MEADPDEKNEIAGKEGEAPALQTPKTLPEPGIQESAENIESVETGHDAVVGDAPSLLQEEKLENLQLTDINVEQGQTVIINTEEDTANEHEVAAVSEGATDATETESQEKLEKQGGGKKKSNRSSFTKLIFRNLPPTLPPSEFLQIVNPDPEDFDYFHFTLANKHFGRDAVGAAYLNFLKPEVAKFFIETFNGYVIVDQNGTEYPMEVDFAISQAVPKPSTKADPLTGTIRQTETFKRFSALFNDSPDGVIGVRPEFTDAKSMSEHVLKEIQEKEGNKGKVISTPLLDSLREKLQAERDKRARERENQIKRRKERDQQRALKKEARREKQEQQRRERREREKREKEKREKERRESKLKQGNKSEKVDRASEKVELKSGSTVDKAEKDNAEGPEDNSTAQVTKMDAQASSSSRNSQRHPKDYDHRQDDYKNQDNAPPHRRSHGRNRYGRRQAQGGEKEKDRLPQKNNDQEKTRKNESTSTKPETSGNAPKENVHVKDEPNPDPRPTNASSSSTNKASANSAKDSTADKPKTKIVKKVVKIVRVKSSDGVPTEGKVVEKKVVKKADDKKSNPENSGGKPSTSKPEGSASKEEAAASSSADRPRRGRPDMQIYRPGSWRQGNSGTSKPNDNNMRRNSATKVQNQDGGSKTKDALDSTKTKETTDESKT